MKKILYVCGILLIWHLAALYIQKMVLPTPIQVFSSFFDCYQSLLIHSGYSIYRIFMGVVLSIIIGLPIGLLMGYFPKIDGALAPLIYLAAPIPKIALLPLIMLCFGIGEMSKIFIIFIIMVFQMIVSVRDSIKNIPVEYFAPFYTVKAPFRWIVKDILIPASLPDTFTALRIGLATGISVLFFTETFGTRYGIGYFIMDMWVRLDYKKMYLGILLLGVIGFLLVFIIDRLERRVCRWSLKYDSYEL